MRGSLLLLLLLTASPAVAQPASVERCRVTAGRAFVAACLEQGEGNLASCRAKAAPAIRRCMAADGGSLKNQKNQKSAGEAGTNSGTKAADINSGQGTLVILMPGAGGITPIDFLVRNRTSLGGSGAQVALTTSSAEAASFSKSAMSNGRKVVLVGMSRGTIDVAKALSAGAQANGVVLVAGAYDNVRSSLGSASRLPQTLIIHHRKDMCRATPPSAVASFAAWSGGRASVEWIDNQGAATPNPCGPRGAHGFFMQDGAAVAAINAFVKSR